MLINLESKVGQNTSILRFFEISIFFCIPIAYITGTFLINIILLLTSIYFFFLSFQKKILFEKKEIYIFCFIVIFLIINSLLADLKNYSLYKSISYLRFVFFLFFGVYFMTILDLKYKKIFSLIFLSVIIFVSFDTLIQFIFDVDLLGNRVDYSHAWGRLSGPFGSEYIVGIYLFCFGFIGFAILRYFYKINKLIEVIYISSLFIIIFLTGERNAVLTTILFLSILFLINKKFRLTIILSTSIIIICCFFILKNSEILSKRYSFSYLPALIENNTNSSEIENKKNTKNKNLNYGFLEKEIKIINNSQWFSHYRGGIEIFKKNVFFGSGFKSFRYECRKIKNKKNITCPTHPHNMYIEFISDTGLIGLLIFLSLMIYIIFYFFKKKLYKNSFESIIFAIFFAFIFPLKPHGSIFSSNNAFMIWYILIFLSWSFFYKDKTKKLINRLK